MLFNSLQYLAFFPVVVALYFSLPYRYRWILLLISSYYFYMCWKVEYILLILISTLVDYWAAIQMGKTKIKLKRRKFLIISLVCNLGLLFAFKYYNFFNESTRLLFQQFNIFYDVPLFNVLLPVGISFYTFQTLSYSIDVYKGEREPERNPGIFAVYVAFFPQLVAGPIERSKTLLPQFYRNNDFNFDRVADGMRQMLWGFFKKVVIADRLAVMVNPVYNNPENYSGFSLLLATYFFAFQIFCDFSGYSDIAIGSARIMGYDLMTNFDRPYFSKSISEFWKRWHISLSSWFRDYLYIPLGGNRVTKPRWYFNMFFVFLASGLWHGANWTFVIWGALHGFYLIVAILLSGIRRRIARFFRISSCPYLLKFYQCFIVFHLVLLAWVFFRANSLSSACSILGKIFTLSSFRLEEPFTSFRVFSAFLVVGFMEIIHLFQRQKKVGDWIDRRVFAVRWAIYYASIIFIIFLGKFEEQAFIYFQF